MSFLSCCTVLCAWAWGLSAVAYAQEFPSQPYSVAFPERDTQCQPEGEVFELREHLLLRYHWVSQPQHQGQAGTYFLMYWHPQQPDEVYLYEAGLGYATGQWHRRGSGPVPAGHRVKQIRPVQTLQAAFHPGDLPTFQMGGYFLAGYGLDVTPDTSEPNPSIAFDEMLQVGRYRVIWHYDTSWQPYLALGPDLCTTFDAVHFSDALLPRWAP